MKERASLYAEAVTWKGGMLKDRVGFIDGTKILIARPSGNIHQRSVYSGYERKH